MKCAVFDFSKWTLPDRKQMKAIPIYSNCDVKMICLGFILSHRFYIWVLYLKPNLNAMPSKC